MDLDPQPGPSQPGTSTSSELDDDPLSEEEKETEEKCLDLLEYCVRAIGEWQAIDPCQYKLINVEGHAPALQPNEDEIYPVELECACPVDWSSELPPDLVSSVQGIRLSVTELEEYKDSPDFGPTFMTPGTEINLCADAAFAEIPDIQEIVNLRKFIVPKCEGKDVWMKYEGIIRENVLDRFREESRAEIFWALKFRNRSCVLVLGIMRSIRGLEEKGFTSWILPNGEKIPLNELQVSCFDVIPRQLWLLEVHKYFQVGAIVLDHEPPNMIPTVVENAVIGRKLIIKDVDPELGLILRHFVIEASLSDGTSFIIDPTARQFRYKGPNGTLVVHRTLDQYVEDFPGVVLSKYPATPEIVSLRTIVGKRAEVNRCIKRLRDCLLKYLSRRFCNYCGTVEGYHPEETQANARHNFEPTELHTCWRCKKVPYCGPMCRKWDWKEHQTVCVPPPVKRDKFGFIVKQD